VDQASDQFYGCVYVCRERGKVFGETAFTDQCSETDDPIGNWWNCHILAGWSAGQDTCPLWERIKPLCQTETEKKFLHWYLRYVKDRQFPMLIPQVRVGIAERKRSDFAAFVPVQYWRYKKFAIELDHAHGEEHIENDKARDQHLKEHGYEVMSLRPNAKGYLEEVKLLVESFENWMNLAETDPWDAAVPVTVTRTDFDPIHDVPL
jgi:very-short-patch-repair endonuclease